MNNNWEVCPRDETNGRWAALYATLNPGGDIVISRFTHEAMGRPEAYLLMFDRTNSVIGLRGAKASLDKNAYPARSRGRHGGRVIRGFRLCSEFGIWVNETVKFPRAKIDGDGVLILDLRQIQTAARQRM